MPRKSLVQSDIEVEVKESEEQVVYRVLRDFKISLGGSMIEFEAGDLVGDLFLIRELQKNKCPIAPDLEGQMVCCPRCGEMFPVSSE